MTEPAKGPTRPDFGAETRSTAKWLIAAFASVAAALIGSIGLGAMGTLHDERLIVACVAAIVGVALVIAAISLVAGVLAPAPVTLADLEAYARRRNEGGASRRERNLVAFVENDATLLQGLVTADDGETESLEERKLVGEEGKTLLRIASVYREALAQRFETASRYWRAKEQGAEGEEVARTLRRAKAANNRALTMHETIGRLESRAAEQATILAFRARRPALAVLAMLVAVSIGAFAVASSPPQPATADLRGAQLEGVDLSGASLRGADLSGMTIRDSNLLGTNLREAIVEDTKWANTVCPDGTNSDNAGKTCAGHLVPEGDDDFAPTALE